MHQEILLSQTPNTVLILNKTDSAPSRIAVKVDFCLPKTSHKPTVVASFAKIYMPKQFCIMKMQVFEPKVIFRHYALYTKTNRTRYTCRIKCLASCYARRSLSGKVFCKRLNQLIWFQQEESLK